MADDGVAKLNMFEIWSVDLPIELRRAATLAGNDAARVPGLRMRHEFAAMYLIGVLAHLEGRFGEACWEGTGHTLALGPTGPIAEVDFRCLHAIRNALIHNEGDIAMNRAKFTAEQMTVVASWPGATLTQSDAGPLTISLNMNFVEVVRVRYVSLWNHLSPPQSSAGEEHGHQ